MRVLTTQEIMVQKNLAAFAPNAYLSNLAMMYFESPQYAHKRLFPICPVPLPSGFFYEFGKEDLARDNAQLKPPHGKVQPAILGFNKQAYACEVYQLLLTQDRIMMQPFSGVMDMTRLRVQTLTEQLALHLELEFAQKFFKTGVWNNEWTGAATANNSQKKFKYFSKSDSDPAAFFDERSVDLKREGRRRPNKIALGVETFAAIKNNPSIKERIKYSGTTQNPAVINEQVLAQIFGVEQVIVLDATYNAAGLGLPADMKYVCDSKGALLLYATDKPAIDSPSAGEIFTWNLSGNDYIAVDLHEGEPASHTDILEGLMAYDMRKTSDALAIYCGGCVE